MATFGVPWPAEEEFRDATNACLAALAMHSCVMALNADRLARGETLQVAIGIGLHSGMPAWVGGGEISENGAGGEAGRVWRKSARFCFICDRGCHPFSFIYPLLKGTAVTGNIGSHKHLEYTVIGDTVSTGLGVTRGACVLMRIPV